MGLVGSLYTAHGPELSKVSFTLGYPKMNMSGDDYGRVIQSAIFFSFAFKIIESDTVASVQVIWQEINRDLSKTGFA